MRSAGAVVVAGILCMGAGLARAGEGEHQTPPASAQLEQLKSLAGRWEGTAQGGATPAEPAVSEYKVTSGGSAVVETIFAGTPHEMVSVYHDGRNGKPSLTHYCMIGNQPEMELTSSDDKQFDFVLAPSSPIPTSEMHMHQVALTWDGPDEITQVWSSYKDGQPTGDSMTLRLKRVN